MPTFLEDDGKKENPAQLNGSTMLHIFPCAYFSKEAELIQKFPTIPFQFPERWRWSKAES